MSKGSSPRPFDINKFNDNFDKIFGRVDGGRKMVYRDKAFCSESFRCGTTTCQWWVDFEVDTDGDALSLAKHKRDDCGWSPVGQVQLGMEGEDE